MNHIEVVGLGALNIDRSYRVEHILDDGEAVVDETELFPGGSAANTIYGLARLRVNTGFIGMLGDIVARFSISQLGARPGLPTLNQLTQRYHELYSIEL